MDDASQDAALRALLAHDGLPERDPMFTYAVMQAVARKRLASEVMGLAPWAAAASAILWLLVPTLAPLLEGAPLDAISPVVIAAIVSLSLLALVGRWRPRLGMTET